MRIGILVSEDSWHFQDLLRASQLEPEPYRHDLISLSFGQLAGGLEARGDHFGSAAVDLSALDRIIARTMPAGSLQQIIFRMDLLGRLEAAGVKIFNTPRAIEISVDKYLSLAMLSTAKINVPPTYVAQTVADGLAGFELLGGDVVFKPIFGSMGNGIVRLSQRADAESFFEEMITAGEVLYLQKFIDHGDYDTRVLVIGDRTIAMRRRRPGHWLTNVAQGATASPIEISPQEREIAIGACHAVGCKIAGVDLVKNAATGCDLVVDVNAAPGWQALSEVTGVDVGALILREVVKG